MSARGFRWSIGLVALAAIALASVWWLSEPEDGSAKSQNGRAFDQLSPAAAGRLLDEAAAKLSTNHAGAAIDLVERLPDELPSKLHFKALQLGDLCRAAGLVSAAEALYRRVLSASPRDIGAHERLAHLLALEGRSYEATPHLVELLKHGRPSVFGLFLIGDAETYFFPRSDAENLVAKAPDDPMANLAKARLEVATGSTADAERRLKSVIVDRPESAEAQAMLGLLLLDHADDAGFLKWNSDLPASCESHPGVWLARGEWARKHDDLRGAARCFWETLRKQPEHRRAMTQLGQVLTALESPDAAAFQERAARLQRLHDVLIELEKQYPEFTPKSLPQMREAATLCESLGRLWEASSWSYIGLQFDPASAWPQDIFRKVRPFLSGTLPQTVEDRHPAWKIDLAAWPLPTLPRDATVSTQSAPAATTSR